MRRRIRRGKSHHINRDISETIQGVLRGAMVHLPRLHGEPESPGIEGDAAFGVTDTDRGMVDAALGSRIRPRKLDQLERMSVWIPELERNDAAGQRLRAASRDRREGKLGKAEREPPRYQR